MPSLTKDLQTVVEKQSLRRSFSRSVLFQVFLDARIRKSKRDFCAGWAMFKKIKHESLFFLCCHWDISIGACRKQGFWGFFFLCFCFLVFLILLAIQSVHKFPKGSNTSPVVRWLSVKFKSRNRWATVPKKDGTAELGLDQQRIIRSLSMLVISSQDGSI